VDWDTLGTVSGRAVTGVATTALADFSYNVKDRANSVTVRVDFSTDSLASITESQLFTTENNAAMLGDELIRFQTVVDNGDGTFTLSNLLRARRGTDWATGTHKIGERFILLTPAKTFFVPVETTYLNQSYLYSGLSHGQDWEDGAQKVYETTLATLKPWSPVHIEGSRDGSNNLTVTWIRRGRIHNEWVDGVDVPLSEDSEEYEVDFYDGSTIVRTKTGLTSETCTYTAAEQTTDGLTPGNPVVLAAYQKSATAGRGWAGNATV
jgi:hypothetical protein